MERLHFKPCKLPEGENGKWKVERFTITKDDARWYNINCHGRPVEPGKYTRLMRGKTIVMSDTPQEMGDHLAFLHRAHGHVLINGLGLGMCLQVLDKPDVTKATVIEIDEEVIALVGPYYKKKYKDRLEIIHADALLWKPPSGIHYGAVWHDIWDNICDDNKPAMKKLHRRYAKICDWQWSWGR